MLPDEAALLRAVCDDPDDDTPRLVYADWLDENPGAPGGTPDGRRARAAFIRLEVELVRHAQTYGDPRWAEIVPQTESLIRAHWPEWVAPLKAVPRVKWPGQLAWPGGYDRGFVDMVEFPTARAFAEQAARAYSLTPAGYLYFSRLTPRTAGALRLPHMRTVHTLNLGQGVRQHPGSYQHRPQEIGPAGAQALAANPTLTRLHTLSLAGCRIGDAGAEALAAAADAGRFPRLNERPTYLAELDLSANGLTAVGLAAVLRSRLVAGVGRLRLACNPLGGAGAAVLAAVPLPETLWELDLNDTDLTDAGVQTLAAAPLSERLEVLCLIYNGLTDGAVETLTGGARPRLKSLYLGYNRITPRGAERLAGWCQGRSNAHVDLRGNVLGANERAGLRPLFGDAHVDF
ncbi:TIGR02996 domain-containing protein [Gemmata sp. JC717]|uniref:TIGR02996 domain-containing protein n=1 Tax=Gemmata algarum TaxID=2975278 RepID=UPI0021BB8DBA|nr:TIGR02996 domain-containing protein [Gemmata algarum]MDY3555632.1 TIGR02996 domain-containing protein [Gemmata algarum]